MENAAKRTIHRVDSWTPEQDRQLAEIVLRNMREGRTQSEGFAEAAEALGRTPGACGFRWNGTVRKRYRDEVFEVRRQRMESMARAGRRDTARIAVEDAIRSLERQELVCLRLERQIAEMSEAISGAVARIRQEIEVLEAERWRTAADSPAPGEE